MITKTSATITNLKNLFIEMFLDKTAKVSNVADGSVVNATAFGVAKVAQKAMKDIAIKEAQIFPDTATGVYLDKAAALYGVSPRKGALGSSTYIRVSADPGTVYDTTVTFVSKNGIRFQVDESLTVGESGYGYVKVRSVNAGYTTNVAPNSITNVNPQPQGHIECTNEYYAIGGRDSEDDETFRIRIKNNLNVLSKNTVEYWTQVLNGIDDRVLKVMAAGLNEQGIYNLYIVSQNGIFFTEDELGTLLEQVQGYFSLSDLNIEGKAVGISLKNIDWFYVGSERGLDFRVQLQPDYDVATVRQNIQVNLTKYLDFRFWTPGDVVEWDDLLDIVKKTEGVKYVPDEYFFPYYDQQVPANQLPRIKGFIMRDQDGNILYDSDSNLSPLFYPAESEDLFVGINDSSLNLYQTAFFNVKYSDGNPVEGVNISIGNNGIITNEQGQASLQLANGQYSYIASLQGYISVEGTFVVLNGTVSIDVEMVRAPYTVTFRVRDERGEAVPYANVTMDNRTTTTNIEGVATLSARNGNYPYLISKLGYDDYSNNVVVQDSNAQVNVEMEFTVWTITVIVKDTENVSIVNAVVRVNNGQYLTNQQGEAEIPLVNGQYPVTIEKAGYDTLNGSITVNNSNADVTFELDYFLYDVLFNIYQVNQGTPAEGALVTIQGQPSALPVNSLGQATTKLKNGEYNYTITKRGYDDLTGSFNVQGQNVNIERTLDLKHYNVVITVLDSDNNEPVQGVAVNINSSSYPTNDKGQVTVSLQNGTYPYTATKSGYYDGDSSVTVLDSDNSSVVNLQARLYNVIMSVRDPERQPIENATVTINNNTYQTQSNGQVSLQLKNGIYPFTVTATGMEDYSDDLTVASADIPLLGISMEYRKYNITFAVTTDEGIAVGNANIHINDNDYQTSQGGLVTIPLSNGTYSYTVAKAGYVPTESSVTVSNADKNVAVTVTAMSYDVTFVVKDNMASPNLLQDVEIQIYGREDALTTNASGEATASLKAGSYNATFAKDGYKGEELSFEVSGEETFTQILKKIWNLSFKVSAAEKTVLQGVTINVSGEALVDGSTTLTTKEDGTTDPVQVVNGAYDWNASLTGYSPEEGVGSVQDADQEKVIELTYGFETTFTTSPATQGVEITIDGNDTITTGQDGIATINLSTGTHTYAYSKTGFLNGTGNVRIEEAEKSVQITLVPGATVTFHTKVGNSALADVKIIVGQSSARALPETIVTNSQGIAAIDLPTGDYQYQIPTTSTDNPNLVEVPSGTFSVATAASAIELDLADYVKYNVTFQTVPSTQDVAISFAKAESPDIPVASGATASNGILTLTYKNGQYIYTAKKSSYKDVTGEFTIAGGDQNITVEMLQISTVTFTVKSQNDSSPIENVVIEMTDRSDSSNKYKGTTNSSGVATMTFDGGEFEWSQDSDADFSGCPVFKEDENYLFSNNITTDQIKTYFPNGVVVSPITVKHNESDPSQVVSFAYMYSSQKINGWEGSWDEAKKNFTLTSVIKESTPTLTEGYILFNVDAGFLMVALGLLTFGTGGMVDYHKSLDFGFKVSGVPSNLKIVVNYGSANEEFAAEMENDVIQRFQLSDLLLEETMTNSTLWQVAVQSSDGSTLSTDDLKNLNITFSFYGKKAISSDIPADKVLYGNYDYTVTPPSPLEAQSGMLNVNAPAINKEILIANNVDVTFKVTSKQDSSLISRPKVGDFVYGDKTWSTELDSAKTCVGVITDVRSKDFDFIGLENLTASFWTNSLGTISDVVTETNESLALCDFAGKTNSQNIILTKPTESTAAHQCAAYSTEGFGTNSWFLPSCGQWSVAQLNRVKIDTSINTTIGSDPLSSDPYWTSTQYDSANAWNFDWINGAKSGKSKTGSRMVRPFCTYEYNPVPNGVYIYDKDNNRYTKEEWASSGKGISDVCGIGISTDTDSFMVSTAISAQNYAFGGKGTLISNTPILDTNVASSDLYRATHGFIYTDTIISQLRTGNAPAAEYAKTYMFGNGQNGYLPSYGEVTTLYSSKTQVEEILRMLDLSLWGSASIQTCTQYWTSNNANLNWTNGIYSGPGKNDRYTVLPFTLLPLPNPAIPIENALVKMTSASNNYQQNTNNNGEAVISAALGVDYDYEVSADGYVTQNGKVGVLNEAKTIEVTLQPASELTVVVHRNTLDGATDISGVQVVVTENKEGGVQMASGTTSQNGTVVLFVPDGSYKVAFSKDGFESKEETVEVSGKTALNTFLLQIYNTINVQVRRVGSINFLPSILELRQSDGTTVLQTANIGGNGSGNFTNLVYGKYVLYVAESNNAKEMRQEITVNSEGMQVQMNLIPLYDLVVKVLPSGGNVTFTGSDGVQKQASTNVSNNAAFYKIPAGNYSINVTGDAGFEPINTTGVIEQTADQTVNLEYTLYKPNKLVQITSNQSNYQLDTSYKYVSLLIVGRGGEKFEYWQSWNSFVLMGGTTGQIVYIPNILISDISDGRIAKITFSNVPNAGRWTYGTKYSIKLGITTYEYTAYNGVSEARNDADLTMPQESRLSNYSVYNAKSSGAIAAHMAGTFYCSGSFGSQNAKEETYFSTGPRIQPDGAPGGDGRYGFKSTYESPVLGNVTKPVQSSVVIPVQSIFGGTSKGASGYLNTKSGQRTGAAARGGAGYGDSFDTSPDGGKTRIAGYGSGQECSPADDDAGNIIKPGEGIFCIYYHNEPI